MDHLVAHVVRDHNDRFNGVMALFAPEIRKAWVARLVLEMMDAQDNQELPISKFVAVYHAVLEKLSLDD